MIAQLTDLTSTTEGREFTKRITDIVRRAESGEDLDLELLVAVRDDERAHSWITNCLRREKKKAYTPTLGTAAPVGATEKYACPTCGRNWIRQSAGQPVPNCADHGILMVRVTGP
jgi:rubrerythrin